MERKRVGIIGGGIVGTALGYYLSEYDNVQVILFEKDQIGSGTTAKSAGTVCLFDDSLSHEFWKVRLLGFQTYTAMEKEEKGSAGFSNTGTLVVATDKKVEDFIKTGIALSQEAGYQAEYIEDHDRILKILPDLNLEGVLGAGWTPDDGYFDPTAGATTFVKKARANGARIMTFTQVTKINMAGGRVTGVDTTGGHFDLDVVVDASGPWTRFTGRMVGLELPIWHTKAEAFFLIPPKKKLDYPFPVLKYPRFYARPEHDNIFICKAHLTMDLNDPMHAGIWDPDKLLPTGGTDQYFLDFIFSELEKHFPSFLNAGLAFSWLGYRAEPPDFMPIIGDSPVEGYMLAIGCGGNGVIEAPAVGTALSKLIATGERSPLIERLKFERLGDKHNYKPG